MAKEIINVEGMSCEHCVKAVSGALSVLPGVSGVSVDLAKKAVTVDYNPNEITLQRIKSEIEDTGYDVV